QEALSNIGKYADVAEASVTLKETESGILVKISDSGKGFSAEKYGHGVGLFSMEERARSIGGRLTVASAPGTGTIVTLTLPYQRSQK
ncbi:MAG: histidine kinase, partial [Paenibacillus sp.]|nr:histidine kinase [Paenibacillus sp.]